MSVGAWVKRARHKGPARHGRGIYRRAGGTRQPHSGANDERPMKRKDRNKAQWDGGRSLPGWRAAAASVTEAHSAAAQQLFLRSAPRPTRPFCQLSVVGSEPASASRFHRSRVMPPRSPRMTLPELRPRLPLAGIALAAALGIALADAWPVDPLAAAGALRGARHRARACGARTVLAWLFAGVAFFTLHTLRHHGGEGSLLAQALGPEPRGGHRHRDRLERAAGAARLVAQGDVPFPAASSRASRRARRGARLPPSCTRAGPGRRRRTATACTHARARCARCRRRAIPASSTTPRTSGGTASSSSCESRYPNDCTVLSHGHGEAIQRFAIQARHYIRHCLELDLQDSPEISALIETMLLGAHSDAPDDVRELFQRTGTMHLFAVSGFNVMMLGGAALGRAEAAARLAPRGRADRHSAARRLRAGDRAERELRARVSHRLDLSRGLRARSPPAAAELPRRLGRSAILAWDTNQLFSTGFQFTFAVVLVLISVRGEAACAREAARRARSLSCRASLWSWRQRAQAYGWEQVSGLARDERHRLVRLADLQPRLFPHLLAGGSAGESPRRAALVSASWISESARRSPARSRPGSRASSTTPTGSP